MNNKHYKQGSSFRQQGSVLLWGLVILLTLTMIGIAAARVGVTDLRIAGNQAFETMAYQGAESALERISTAANIKTAVDQGGYTESWEDKVNNDGVVNAKGTLKLQGEMMCAGGVEGRAMSIQMTPEQGGVACLFLTVDARAQLAGTGARSVHEVGVLRPRGY